MKKRYLKISHQGIQVVIPRLNAECFFSLSGGCNFEAVLAEAEAYRNAVLEKHGQLSLLSNIPHLNAKGGNSPLAGVYL